MKNKIKTNKIMTKQAENFCGLCRGNDESSIRRALDMVSASVRNEIIARYGDINTAVTHIKLGTK